MHGEYRCTVKYMTNFLLHDFLVLVKWKLKDTSRLGFSLKILISCTYFLQSYLHPNKNGFGTLGVSKLCWEEDESEQGRMWVWEDKKVVFENGLLTLFFDDCTDMIGAYITHHSTTMKTVVV